MLELALALVVAGVTAFTPPAMAAVATPVDPADQRAHEVADLISSHPAGYDAIFAPSFLREVPPTHLDTIFLSYFKSGGPVVSLRRGRALPGWTARYVFLLSKGHSVTADLMLEPAGLHRLTGMVLGNPAVAAANFAELTDQLAKLPGHVSFQATRWGPNGPEILASLAPDHAMALGSAFKLFLLGALTEDIAAGRRHWTDIVTLDAAHKSLPSGMLQAWPDGAPVTLYTLAALMISISDNTATDHMLALLGRERVERMLAKMGVADPARSRPLLATHEMFLLKWGQGGPGLDAYAALDEKGRRAALAKLDAGHLKDLHIDPATPVGIDKVEWFASAADLGRMLNWLRIHTETGEAAKVRDLIAINPGLRFDPVEWPYVGYKGGSEPGVLSLAFLLRAADGRWYTLTAVWNDPHGVLDEKRLELPLQRAGELMSESR